LDNEPRNKQVVEAMERLLEDGHMVCVWSERFRGLKDINDMVLSGHGRSNILHDIMRNSYSGLAGHIALKKWAK
jgi:hypothetical protein